MEKTITKDGVAILRKHFIKGDIERLSSLEAEREKIKIAEQIYALRKQRGLTQKQLAVLMGTTQSVISRLEDTDYENERIDTLQKIATALNCHLEVKFVPEEKITLPSQLDKINISEVWKEFSQTYSEACRNILMENYLHLAKLTAERIWVKLPDKVDLDDLIQAGIFGLMDAIDAYDPERGVKFETYCAPRIRSSILDELRSMDWVPRLVSARAHQLDRAKQILHTRLGRMPTDEELATEMELNPVEFHRLQRDANAIGLISLNNKFNQNKDEKDAHEIDIIQDQKGENPVTEAQKRDLKNLVFKGLTRTEKLFVYLCYYEEMTMKEIGATLDLSESRVSQMHSSIVQRLKAQMDIRKKEFITPK